MTRFKCYNCMHCCFFTTPNDYPIILKEEVGKLNNLASKFGIKLSFKKLNNEFYLWVIKGFCPFYSIRDRKCMIHKDKPLSCKMFPLILNIRSGEVSVSMLCDWVAENFEMLKELNIMEVFPNEMRAVLKLFKWVVKLSSGHSHEIKER